MKSEKNRIALLAEFYSAPNEALFDQNTLCAVLNCSTALAERNRWVGTGVPYLKIGAFVRYKKSDILSYLDQQELQNSTAQNSTITPIQNT